MAEYTQNLNLEKPTENENFRRQVLNDNMDKIDKKFGTEVGEGHAHDGTIGQGKRISYNNLEDKPATMTPTVHKISHAIGGSDVITPADIGAETPTGAQAKVDVVKGSLDAHLVDNMQHVPYVGTTEGTGNAFAVTITGLTSYIIGCGFAFMANRDSTGNSTINVNGLGAKNLVDQFGNIVNNLKQYVVYTVRYNGTNFIVQGKGGGGNAVASDLLLGKTATVDSGKITGTLDLSNLIAGNIKKDMIINGVTGTLEPSPYVTITAGDVIVYNDTSQTYKGENATWTKVKEATVQKSGTIRVWFSMQCNVSGYNIDGRVYINDIPRGILRSTISNTSWTQYVEDFTVNVGDRVSVYASTYVGQYGDYYGWIKDFKFGISYAPVLVI